LSRVLSVPSQRQSSNYLSRSPCLRYCRWCLVALCVQVPVFGAAGLLGSETWWSHRRGRGFRRRVRRGRISIPVPGAATRRSSSRRCSARR